MRSIDVHAHLTPQCLALDWPVSWILAMESLTQAEKEAILWRNLERLLSI
jgi:hypothetical protein